jgi:hypothetical protein
MPVVAIPSTKRRWMTRKNSTTGIRARTEAAIRMPNSTTCWPMNRARPAGRVCLACSWLMISGHSRSFQLYMKWNSPRVSSAGAARGMMILR